ncbi:DUF3987 domain-containing protein [Acidithiobacillus ferrivorans]|nr:DUF3987 domain-containing protein [Acidithiobacillus ferrivorans]
MNWDNVADSIYQAADATDGIIPPPVPDNEAMLSGIIGEIARVGSDGKEVHPVAVAAASLSWLSAEIGPDIFLPLGDTNHHCNLFTLHIGRSARGGKGEALGLVKRIRKSIIDDRYDHPCGQTHNGGLSSREGLAGAVHDGYKQGKEEVPPVYDKRLWVVEAEFANTLAQGRRDGNTLLPALREVWDGGNIQPLTKGKGIWSTHPHIALHGNITPGELQSRIETREITGGTFNRILMVWAERTCLVALPDPTDASIVGSLARHLDDRIRWARGSYPTARDNRRASLTPCAAKLWLSLYPEIKRPHPAGDLVAAATERRAPICLRIALIHAILEKSLLITEAHIKVGYSWAQYGATTAAYVLAGLGGKARDQYSERKLLQFLRQQPRREADRRTLTNVCFQKHVSGPALDSILSPLVDDGEIIRREEEPRAGGRKRVIYLLRADNADFADNKQHVRLQICGASADFADNERAANRNPQSPHDVRNAEMSADSDYPQSPQAAEEDHLQPEEVDCRRLIATATIDDDGIDFEDVRP